MAVKEGAYLAVIVVLAVLVGAMGAYIYLQHTASRSVTSVTQTQPATTTTQQTSITPTITITPTTQTSTVSTITTTTSTPTTAATGVCLSGTESYNETYALSPPNIPPPNYYEFSSSDTLFYVPFGTTATYYLDVEANTTVTVDIRNATATSPEVIFPRYIFTTNGQVKTAKHSGTLTPGLYDLGVINNDANTYVQVTQQLVVKYSPTSSSSKCYGKITGSTTTTLGLPPPLTPPPPYPVWMFGFFVPQGATGNVTVTYTSNTTLQVVVTNNQVNSTFYVPPQDQQSGTYTVTNLPPGGYYVSINVYGPGDATLNVNITAEYSAAT